MFDRNQFKESFRAYLSCHPRLTEDDVIAYCQSQIPVHCMVSEYWLVDQCLQWFRWLQTQPGRRALVEENNDLSSGRFEEDTH